MADEILTQAEVESLLSTMEHGKPAPAAAPPVSHAPAAPAPSAAPRSKIKTIPYDFKRPERVGKEQMRALQTLHEGFGRNFGAALSGLLRRIVEVKLTSVDQLTYSEFVFSLENPTCFNVLRADPLEGSLILDINPSILYPILDRLLGGGKEPTPPARRPLTEIELRIVSRITRLFLDELKHAWSNVVDLVPSVERVESNPQLVQIVPPNEVVILISFELTVGDLRGMMNLCIPFNSIERVSGKLTSNSWLSYSRAASSPDSKERVKRQLGAARVELVATLAETRITTADLLNLRVGDVITTDKDQRRPLEVAVAGRPKFAASAGTFKGQLAVRIEEPLPVADT